ncbi:signal peptidase II [Dongia deserti]|uniref:signal peptidase II n=1 Tax=Dongia deserti TaxID=2268030 RepID=UPI000E657F75|nr:signal peptidase II [Dongia deserti]
MRLTAPRLFYRMCGLSAVVVLLDQVTKLWVFRILMEDQAEIAVLPIFSLVKRYNTGISFSIFATDHAIGPWIFALLATIIAVGLLIWLSQTADRVPAVGLALVVGGAIGNVIDRVREGAVMDFLLFHWEVWAWPAFNLADTAITIGVALLIYDGMFGGKKRA